MLQSCTPPLPPALLAAHPVLPTAVPVCVRFAGRANLPFATTPQSARLLAAPLHHTSASAVRPTDPTLRQAQGYTVALPSAQPHPRALHATPLVSVIASRFGECRAVLAQPFWRWRRTSLSRHGKECRPQVPGTTAGTFTAARVHHPPAPQWGKSGCAGWHSVDRPQGGAVRHGNENHPPEYITYRYEVVRSAADARGNCLQHANRGPITQLLWTHLGLQSTLFSYSLSRVLVRFHAQEDFVWK
ncbi:hypothetical protein B0H14DRAFT_2918717 [Mycena olivaceomarginata]|nr:hypothetical protein B0H14DRAFT_2918717 [Mycena olivaceomarginata]